MLARVRAGEAFGQQRACCVIRPFFHNPPAEPKPVKAGLAPQCRHQAFSQTHRAAIGRQGRGDDDRTAAIVREAVRIPNARAHQLSEIGQGVCKLFIQLDRHDTERFPAFCRERNLAVKV